jgi:Flp pilus assembly protein TadG
MSASSSDPARLPSRLRRLLPRQARNERGGILILTALVLVALMATGGLVIDMGQVYIARSELSSVADAGALAGARISRLGESRARTAVMNLAAANGVVKGTAGADVTMGFAKDSKGRQTVSVTVSRPQKLVFSGMLGFDEISMRATATATGPPVDLVMVIDQSGSLAQANAWDEVQSASKSFVGLFGDGYDKLSLVSFQTVAAMRNTLSSSFRTNVQRSIDGMDSFGATNMTEGLRKARDELNSSRVQQGSLKAVIFFTDGWANAYRASYNGREMIVTTSTSGPYLVESEAHYFLDPDAIPVDHPVSWDGDCDDNPTKKQAVCPWTWTPQLVVSNARAQALARATELRQAGIYVYTIGMKDTQVKQDPDMAFLRQMANENGQVSMSEPHAKAYYAPSAADLHEIFTRVAADIMVHLVQ